MYVANNQKVEQYGFMFRFRKQELVPVLTYLSSVEKERERETLIPLLFPYSIDINS